MRTSCRNIGLSPSGHDEVVRHETVLSSRVTRTTPNSERPSLSHTQKTRANFEAQIYHGETQCDSFNWYYSDHILYALCIITIRDYHHILPTYEQLFRVIYIPCITTYQLYTISGISDECTESLI